MYSQNRVLGGGAFDVRYASDQAKLSMLFSRRGMTADHGMADPNWTYTGRPMSMIGG